MLTLRQDGLPQSGGALLLCPVVDLTFERRGELPEAGEHQPILSPDHWRSFADSYLGGHPIDDPLISPYAPT
jgi:acetyl esterase/lipase